MSDGLRTAKILYLTKDRPKALRISKMINNTVSNLYRSDEALYKQVTVGLWVSDDEPDFSETGYDFVFNDLDNKSVVTEKAFIDFVSDITQNRKMFAEKIMKEFPDFEYEVSDKQYSYYLRIVGKSSKCPIILDKPYDEIMEQMTALSKQVDFIDSFVKNYPNLYFADGIGHSLREPVAYQNTTINVYILRMVNGERRDGTHTGYSFHRSEASFEYNLNVLEELNKQAALANQEGWFFCTNCQEAYDSSNYGGFWFAATRCKECANLPLPHRPNKTWRQAAAEENYN